MGAYLYDNGDQDEGRAFLYQGSASGLPSTPHWTAEGNQAAAYFGVSVAGAGDVNGDGYSDVVVGAHGYDTLFADDGKAFLYFGNGGPGLSPRPRQRRAGDTAPIAHLGASDSFTSFRLGLLARTPFGRSRAKLEWEVKPLGTLFDGTGLESGGSWTDTGVAGASLSEVASGLATGEPYHWRVRLVYDPTRTPLQRRSRWMTIPWSGWQETMVRAGSLVNSPAGRVPETGTPLTLAKSGIDNQDLTLSWGASCLGTDVDYAIYYGPIGNFTSLPWMFCSTEGATTKTFPMPGGSDYFLVVPVNGYFEGSYGTGRAGVERPERPAATSACLPQYIGTCP